MIEFYGNLNPQNTINFGHCVSTVAKTAKRSNEWLNFKLYSDLTGVNQLPRF
jgi:hypothetical protein